MTSSQHQWLHSSAGSHWHYEVTGSNTTEAIEAIAEAIAEIAFITARIIASLDFICAVRYMIHFIYHFVLSFKFCLKKNILLFLTKHEMPTMYFVLHDLSKDHFIFCQNDPDPHSQPSTLG